MKRIRWPRINPCPKCGLPPFADAGLMDQDGNILGPFFVYCAYMLPPYADYTCNQFVAEDSPRKAAKAWNELPVQPPILRGTWTQGDDVSAVVQP